MMEKNTINKDDLIGVARTAEMLQLCLSDVEQDYFGETKSKEYIEYNFDRVYMYLNNCIDMANSLTKELHQHGIWCFRKE